LTRSGAALAAVGGAVDGPADGWWQRHQCDPVALAVNAKDSVPTDFAERLDVCARGLEDPEAEQPEQGDERKVVDVR
jgi:hypothetical protein